MSIIHVAVRPVSRIDRCCLFAELVRFRTLIPINTARRQRFTMDSDVLRKGGLLHANPTKSSEVARGVPGVKSVKNDMRLK